MKDFITKMMCTFLLLIIGSWSLMAQAPVLREDVRDGVPFVPEENNTAGGSTYVQPKLTRADLYDNGPLVTHPGEGANGADVSVGSSLWGTGCQFTANNWVADDFEVDKKWTIDQIEFFGYQTGSGTASTMNGVYLAIFDTDPSTAGATPIWGDFTTNVFESSSFINCYRIIPTSEPMTSTSRPIMSLIANTEGLALEPGVYWLMTTWSGTGSSGPWAPPISIVGQPATGNGKLRQSGVWSSFLEDDNQQGLPFRIYGSAGGDEAFYDHYAPPTNVTATANGNNVTVKWKAPEGVTIPNYEGWITHSNLSAYDNVGASGFPAGLSTIFLSRWTPEEMQELPFAGGEKLAKINYWGGSGTYYATGTFKIKIYQGGSLNGSTVNVGTLIHEETLSVAPTSGVWNELTLSTPIAIDRTKELMFGIEAIHSGSVAGGFYPISLDDATSTDAGYNIIKWHDDSWSTLAGLAASFGTYNFMLQAYITDANGKAIVLNKGEENGSKAAPRYYIDEYEVFCNDYLVGRTIGTSFIHNGAMVAGGELDYCVRSVFNDGGKSEFACAETLDAGAGTITINPGCLTSIMFTEDFEPTSPTVGQWVNERVTGTTDWSVVPNTTGTPNTTPSGATGHKARFYYSAGRGHVSRFISPAFDLSDSENAMLSFWHTQRVWLGDQDELRIYYAHSASGPWTQIAEYTQNITDWTEETITLPDPSATYYIAFEGTIDFGYGCQLDDVTIYGGEPDLPTPEAPVNLTAAFDELNWYNVNLNWEMHSTVGVAGYYVYRGGILLNYSAPVGKDAMKYLDVVPGAATYLYEVQAISIDGCLSEKTPLTVVVESNPCDGFKVNVYPYEQGFEDSQNLLELCWYQEIMKGTVAWEIVSANTGEPATSHSGANKIRYYYNGQLEQVARLMSPMFDLSEGGGKLSFWYTNKEWYLGQDVLRIYYKTKVTGDWILLETFNENIGNWTQVTLDLPDNTNTYWLCFEGNTSQGYGVQLDDIKVTGCALQRELPWIEGFENGVDVLNCWVQEPENSGYLWSVVPASTSSPTTAHSGAYKLRYNTSTFSGYKNLISSPNFNFGRENFDFLKFSFWHTQQVWTPDQDELRFFYKTDPEAEWTQLGEWTSNIATWKQESFIFTDVASTFRFAFEGKANYGYGVQIDDINITPCSNIEMPFEETFDTEIPICWDNITTAEHNAPWKFVTTGTSPSCTPHSAGGMLQYNCFSYTSGKKAQLYTAPVAVPVTEEYVKISFWMYRDNGYATYSNERVNLYISSTRSIDGLSPVLSIPRVMAFAPVETTAGWYQYSAIVAVETLPSRKVHFVLEGVSQYGNNIYVDDLTAEFYYCEDNIADLPIVTSFENEFPEVCWDLTATNATVKWKQSTAEAYDGTTSIMADCWSAPSGTSTALTTRSFYTEGKNQIVSFWMYRNSSLSSADRVSVYLTEDGDITGVTPLLTINRYIGTAPAVPADGWYQYIAELPCASMTTAKVTFQAISAWGDDVFIDMVEIGDLCLVPQNVVAVGQGEVAPFWTEAYITWDVPQIVTESLDGYKVYRDGTLVATVGVDIMEYTDDISSLSAGCYEYSVSATYNNDCGESNVTIAPDDVCIYEPCEDTPGPSNVTHVKHVDEWYDVDITWTNPTGADAFTYVQGLTPNNAFQFGDGFGIAIRISPEDLAAYNGKQLSKVRFVPYDGAATYTIKVWTGGNGMNPGTEVYSKAATAAEVGDGGVFEWRTAKLSPQVTIDASKEMWIGIIYTNISSWPAGACPGPVVKPGYSNLLYNQGSWVELSAQAYNDNWALVGFVRTMAGNDEVIGYNVYKDDILVTNPMLYDNVESYRDRVPGPGTYTYQVSAIYDANCESAKVETVVEMEQSPCDALWTLPIIESFDGFDRFPPWCWELSEGNYPWKHVAAGTSPTCQPHSGAGMLQYNCYSYMSGNSGLLISPEFVTSDQPYTLKFWMYRDAGYASSADRVEVYLSENETTTGLTPLLTVNRSTNLPPQVSEAGWYEYSAVLNTAGMNKARVILKGISGWGNNVYVDDITIVDEVACDPINNIVVEQPNEGEVLISWDAPLNTGLVGYRVFRDGVLIANNLTETFITDYVSLGAHEYCITALFNKAECTESLPVCVTIDVFAQCDAVKSVTAEVVGMHKVQVSWVPTAASGVTSYTLYRDGSMLQENIFETSYTDEPAPAGSHYYSVVVNYSAKPCQMSDIVDSNSVSIESCVPVTNLTHEVSDDVVTLNWDFDGTKSANGTREVLISENFESGWPTGWTKVDADGDGHNWEATMDLTYLVPGQGYNGSEAMSSCSYYNPTYQPLTPDNWLVLPAIEGGGKFELSYKVVAQDAGYPAETYGVYVSTSGTNPSDFTEIFSETLTAKVQGQWFEHTIDLGAYMGTIYVAFRHFDSYDMFMMMLDDVELVKTGSAITFDVFKDGSFIENVPAMTWEDTGVQPGTYQYCVRPIYEQCTVDLTCVEVTVEECILGDVTNVTAVQDKVEKPQRVDISWSYSGEPAEFEIQRSEGGDFTKIATVSDMSFSDTDVEYNKSYTYCVKAVKEGCISGAIGCDNEIVEKPEGIETLESALNIYPNPASTTVTIEGGNVIEIEVYNAVGQLVDRIMAIEGETVKQVNVAGYEAGAYLFRLRSANQETVNKPIMVVR